MWISRFDTTLQCGVRRIISLVRTKSHVYKWRGVGIQARTNCKKLTGGKSKNAETSFDNLIFGCFKFQETLVSKKRKFLPQRSRLVPTNCDLERNPHWVTETAPMVPHFHILFRVRRTVCGSQFLHLCSLYSCNYLIRAAVLPSFVFSISWIHYRRCRNVRFFEIPISESTWAAVAWHAPLGPISVAHVTWSGG